MWPCSTSAIASATSATGSEIDRDVRIMIGMPNRIAASETTRIGTSSEFDCSTSQPVERITTNVAITPIGNALHRNQSRTSRAKTPGTISRGSHPRVAALMIGRRVRCASNRPVPAAAAPPISTPSEIGTMTAAPPSVFGRMTIRPHAAHVAASRADCRPAIFIAASRCSGVGSSPAVNQRRVGASNMGPMTATEIIPSTISSATSPVFFSAKSALATAGLWPLIGIRIAAESTTAMMYASARSVPY